MKRTAFPTLLVFVLVSCGSPTQTGWDGGDDGTDTLEQDTLQEPDMEVADDPSVDDVDGESPGCVTSADCDDSDPCTVDVCDESDAECSHVALDVDDDGYVATHAPTGEECGGTDCDDSDADVYPGSDQRRCAEDADCNGETDADNDGDGSDSIGCSGDDCDDEDDARYPGAETVCGLVDHDCNGFGDSDNDGDGSDSVACSGDDCDDGDPESWPGAPELCGDGVDQDCDTLADTPVVMGSEIRVTSAAQWSSYPAIAWTGSRFGLAWHDGRDGGMAEMYFGLLSADGSKVGSDTRLSTTSADSANASMRWTGSEFGLAWQDQRSGNHEIYFARIGSSGTKIGTEFALGSVGPGSYNPHVEWTGSEFAVVWYGGLGTLLVNDVYFTRVSAGGVEVGSDVQLTTTAGNAAYPVAAYGASEFAVAWHDDRDGGDLEIYVTRCSDTGVESGADQRFTEALFDSAWPWITWSGSEFALVWEDRRDGNAEVWFARMDGSGVPVGSPVALTTDGAGSGHPRVAWSGSLWGVTWYKGTGFLTQDIFFAALEPEGAPVGSAVSVTSSSSYKANPVVTWSGSEFGLAWEDNRDGNMEIYFARLGFCQ